MGHKNSPPAASIITKTLVRMTLQHFKEHKITFDYIIDDVLFACPEKGLLHSVMHHFDQLCERFGITIGSSTEPATEVVFRGVHFDLHRKTMQLKQEFIDKFKERYDMFRQKQTLERADSLMGSICYAAQILNMKHLSLAHQRVLRAHLTSHIDAEAFTEAVGEVCENAQVALPADYNTPSAGFIMSDATPIKAAAMYVNQNGTVKTVVHEFRSATPIHIAEAMGTNLAWQLVPRFDTRHEILIYTDNTTWLHSSNVHRISSDSLSDQKNTMADEAEKRNLSYRFLYVPSKANPMDEMSRGGKAPNKAQIRNGIRQSRSMQGGRGRLGSRRKVLHSTNNADTPTLENAHHATPGIANTDRRRVHFVSVPP